MLRLAFANDASEVSRVLVVNNKFRILKLTIKKGVQQQEIERPLCIIKYNLAISKGNIC